MENIVQKCIDWNAARYEQVFNYELASKLLLEETDELFEASSVNEMLDAIGDITFVTIGVMWKLGLHRDYIKEVFYANPIHTMNAITLQNLCCKVLYESLDQVDLVAEGAYPGLSLALHCTLITAVGALRGLGMQASFYDIVDAICESNNTKEIKGKVDPSVKANVVKGAGFIPPTAKLNEIELLYSVRKSDAAN